jgi:hypothetical protein
MLPLPIELIFHDAFRRDNEIYLFLEIGVVGRRSAAGQCKEEQ